MSATHLISPQFPGYSLCGRPTTNIVTEGATCKACNKSRFPSNNSAATASDAAATPRITSATAVLTEGDQVTNVSFPQWGPATVVNVQTTDDGTVYVAARYLYSGETFSGTQQAYAYATCDHGYSISTDTCPVCDASATAPVLPILDPETVNDYRTWTFAGSEGATETITSSDAHLTIETARSGYDGYRETTLVFVQHTPADAFPAGTHDNTDRNGPTRVLVPVGTDPRDAHADYLRSELGHYLATRYCTAQPEPTDS